MLTDQGPQPTRVTIGASDGKLVEIKEGLSEGARVITGIEGPPAAAPRGTPGNPNPFNPQMQRRQR